MMFHLKYLDVIPSNDIPKLGYGFWSSITRTLIYDQISNDKKLQLICKFEKYII